jgi:hypothetical protein
MNALRRLFLVPLSILCFHSTAQVEDLMRDKNISWMVESYNDFITDAIAQEKIGKRISGVRMLKFYNPTESDVPEEFLLQNNILELAKAEKLTIYKDDRCTQEVSYEIASGWLDTLIITNPTTYEPRTCSLGRGWISYEDILFFRAHQILYYDSSKVQFGLRTLAIAPMRKVTDERGEIVNWQPIFWLKVTDLKEKRNLSDGSIMWAKRMTLIDGVPLKSDSVKILKKTGENMPLTHLCKQLFTNPEIPFYRADEVPIKTTYNMTERENLFIERDSISTIEPTTYAVKVEVSVHEIKEADIKELRIVQNWYWDAKKEQLEIWLSAVGPLIDVKNETGEFLFKRPLFYRRTDD